MRSYAEEAETAAELKACLESTAVEVDGLLDSIQVLRGLAAGRQMRIDELTRNLHVADGEIAAAKKQLSDLKNINTKLERQRKEAVQNEDKARMAWSLCQSENRALQARVDELLRATQARPV
jgi:chromosome segregation ATPase